MIGNTSKSLIASVENPGGCETLSVAKIHGCSVVVVTRPYDIIRRTRVYVQSVRNEVYVHECTHKAYVEIAYLQGRTPQ